MSQSVSVSRVIDAPAEQIFAFLCDPANHPRVDGSGHVRSPRSVTTLTGVGDTFTMNMRWGVPYRMRNTVVEYEQDRRIAWHHINRHRWRYELEPVEDGTKVTETFDAGPAWMPMAYYRLMGFPDGIRQDISRTLERLEEEIVGARAT